MRTYKMLYVCFNAPTQSSNFAQASETVEYCETEADGLTWVNVCQGCQYLTKSNEHIYSKLKLEGRKSTVLTIEQPLLINFCRFYRPAATEPKSTAKP